MSPRPCYCIPACMYDQQSSGSHLCCYIDKVASLTNYTTPVGREFLLKGFGPIVPIKNVVAAVELLGGAYQSAPALGWWGYLIHFEELCYSQQTVALRSFTFESFLTLSFQLDKAVLPSAISLNKHNASD